MIKENMNCLICEKDLFSELSIGCKLCGMPLEEDDEFCCKDCSIKYVLINGEIN